MTCIDHGGRGNRGGYRTVWYQGKYIGAHVRELIRKTGEQPAGRVVRHTCDNPRCINREHLLWGTRSDNLQDSVSRHRFKNQMLSAEAVRQIRIRYSSEGRAALALEFGATGDAVYSAAMRRTWRHIE